MKFSEWLINEGIAQARQRYLKKFKRPLTPEKEQYLLNTDPTPQKKYVDWIVKANKQLNIYLFHGKQSGNLDQIKEFLTKYDKLLNKNLLPPEDRDIYKISDIDDLIGVVTNYNKRLTKAQIKKAQKSGAEKVYEDKKWIIVYPKTRNACRYYGKGTKWCITSPETNHWRIYTEKKGMIFYFIINKQKPNEKYAVAIDKKTIFAPTENWTIQYWNAKDERLEDIPHHVEDAGLEYYIEKHVIDNYADEMFGD